MGWLHNDGVTPMNTDLRGGMEMIKLNGESFIDRSVEEVFTFLTTL
jgi:hypothetical protein